MNDEIQPFLICRVQNSQMEFALWQLRDGQRGLCIFLSKESAEIYRGKSHQNAEWKIIQPERETLLEILKASNESGVPWAVLEPDQEQAKRIFDVGAILNAAMQSPFLK
jgi:hypothetical protein